MARLAKKRLVDNLPKPPGGYYWQPERSLDSDMGGPTIAFLKDKGKFSRGEHAGYLVLKRDVWHAIVVVDLREDEPGLWSMDEEAIGKSKDKESAAQILLKHVKQRGYGYSKSARRVASRYHQKQASTGEWDDGEPLKCLTSRD